MMRKLLVLLALCSLIGAASAVPVNFTEWEVYGDAWKANNDTYTIVKWNSTGSHPWLSTGNTSSVEYLVVAAGGGGGGSACGGWLGGGAGAGGILNGTAFPVSGSVSVTVGSGGTAGAANTCNAGGGNGGKGGNSSFSTIQANGGGYGAGVYNLGTGITGGTGGSGGGSTGANSGGVEPGGLGTVGQGYNGAASGNNNNVPGAGGGASSAGSGTTPGPGFVNIITGTATTYSAGGGTNTGAAGAANTGNGGAGGIAASNGAGGVGGTGIVIISYLSPSGIPVASFTCTPTSTTLGTPIACTDTSSDTPTNWTYYWGDGNVTDGTQNPSYTYPFTGTFSINQTVNNTLGASWYNRSNYITITNVTSFTQQDIYLTGQYTITFNVKSSTTNLSIANVTVVDSISGQSYPSTNGTAFLTEPAGLIYVNFIADGYQTKQVTYVVDMDETHEVKLVPSETPNNPVYNVYPPKDVKFHITSFFGAPIQNANVTIQGITTSTGNWDWLVTLLGISLDEVAINGTAMTESTDTNGDVVFLMLPSVKYNITTTATGYTFPTSFIAPQAIEYTITANWNESWFSSGNDTLKDVNVSVSWVKKNDTYSFVNISYDDQTLTTTGGTIQVYLDSAGRVANATSVATMDITSSSCSNSTIVNTPTGGASYRVLVNATTTDQNIVRTFTHYFKGAPVTLPGFDSESILWLALFIVIFTAAFAGAIHSPQMSIVLCVESWVFWAIGWLDALITQFWYGETAIIGILTLASFIALLWNITEGKSKVKRSS